MSAGWFLGTVLLGLDSRRPTCFWICLAQPFFWSCKVQEVAGWLPACHLVQLLCFHSDCELMPDAP